jgi:pyruvate formate lyase activating enzyme
MIGCCYKEEADGRLRCLLCPNSCVIAEGRHGACRVRFNRSGKLDIPFYGELTAVAVDPIEKKPLYHYYPASSILSIGFVGCSLHCPFCQNYSISQGVDSPTHTYSPEEVVRLARREKSFGIAYTYSEPLIHFEYVLETSRLARREGLKNVLVTNGYISPEPAGELLAVVDAANVDLKTFNPEFYSREIGGKLEEVKRFMARAGTLIHLEVTTLVSPTKNDSSKEIEAIASFLAGLNPDIPYHLSCYYPTYKYRIPPTPPETVESLAAVARRHLNYVYTGNVGLADSSTICPECGELLVYRSGYHTRIEGLSKGRCKNCGHVIPVCISD